MNDNNVCDKYVYQKIILIERKEIKQICNKRMEREMIICIIIIW